MENHLAQIAFGKAVGGLGRDESAFDGGLAHAVVVDAAAVVFHFYVDMVSAVVGAQGYPAGVRLAGRLALIGKFDTVRDGRWMRRMAWLSWSAT